MEGTRSIYKYLGLLCIICSIILCLSCNSNDKYNNQNAIVIKFDIDGKGINVPFRQSVLFDSVWYVKIDTSASIGYIAGAKLYKGKFYVLDGSNESIITVDSNGRVNPLINHRGRAKDEYLSIFKFDINYGNGQILIYDQAGDKVLAYSNNGDFIRSIDLKKTIRTVFRDFAVFSNGNILGCYLDYDGVEGADDIRGVLMLDSLGNFIKRLYHPDKSIKYTCVTNEHFCKIDGGTISFLPEIGNDTIYHFTEDGNSVAKYVIDCGLHIDRDFLEREETPFSQLPLPENYHMLNHWESKYWLLCNVFTMESQNTSSAKASICYEKISGVPHVMLEKGGFIFDMNHIGSLGAYENIEFDIMYPESMPSEIIDKFVPALKGCTGTVIQLVRVKQ